MGKTHVKTYTIKYDVHIYTLIIVICRFISMFHLFKQFMVGFRGQEMGYELVAFSSRDRNGQEIYHTNVTWGRFMRALTWGLAEQWFLIVLASCIISSFLFPNTPEVSAPCWWMVSFNIRSSHVHFVSLGITLDGFSFVFFFLEVLMSVNTNFAVLCPSAACTIIWRSSGLMERNETTSRDFAV